MFLLFICIVFLKGMIFLFNVIWYELYINIIYYVIFFIFLYFLMNGSIVI